MPCDAWFGFAGGLGLSAVGAHWSRRVRSGAVSSVVVVAVTVAVAVSAAVAAAVTVVAVAVIAPFVDTSGGLVRGVVASAFVISAAVTVGAFIVDGAAVAVLVGCSAG